MVIDINCDMGESYGRYKIGNDADIIPYVSSCNIACGKHGGDPVTILNTVKMAVDQGKKIGAHPSYPDRQGFGRRSMEISERDLFALLVYQISVLYTMAEKAGSKLSHVKVHGALYNDAAKDETIAQIVLDAVEYIDPELYVFALPRSAVSIAGNSRKMKIMHEAFADRRYTDQLRLQSRTIKGSVIEDSEIAVQQVIDIVMNNRITTVSGTMKPLKAETICIHGDTRNALTIARTIHERLKKLNITIA